MPRPQDPASQQQLAANRANAAIERSSCGKNYQTKEDHRETATPGNENVWAEEQRDCAARRLEKAARENTRLPNEPRKLLKTMDRANETRSIFGTTRR